MVLAGLTMTGALLGPALQVIGLEECPLHPVIHSLVVLPSSPLARRQFAKTLVPVWDVLDRQARLENQPRLADSHIPSASEELFGRTGNPEHNFVPQQDPLRSFGRKPGLLACAASLDHIKKQAELSIDRHLLFDGTGVEFGPDLLDLPPKEWAALMSALGTTFHRGLFQPDKHPAWLSALWVLNSADSARVWERMSRAGRRPPPFIAIGAGADDAQLSQNIGYSDKWHSWCENLLVLRTSRSHLPVRTFSKSARGALFELHDELVALEESHPVAGAYGVGHFLTIAERIAALLSITVEETEIRTEDLLLALELTRYYLRLHLQTLEDLLRHPLASCRSRRAAAKPLEELLLQKLISSPGGLTVRELTRSFHRGPDVMTIRLALQRLEVTGAVEWKNDQVVGVSAPTKDTDG